MTELTGPDESSAQPSREWPLLDTGAIKDPLVAGALAGLEPLPGTEVEEHEEAYARLHDELLAALNAKPQEAQPRNPGQLHPGQLPSVEPQADAADGPA